MIYDCFLFNDEIDLLRLRLAFLDKTVDRFVLVESARTLSGQAKPLHYQLNQELFKPYLHKIIHVIAPVNDMSPWEFEFYQRNCIKEGLKACKDDDLIFISDADEIVNIGAILSLKKFEVPAVIELPVYYYFFNLKTNSSFRVNLVSKWGFLKDRDLGNRNENFPKWAKMLIADQVNPGWHFSYCFGNKISSYQEKIRSFSHQEYNTDHFLDSERISGCIREGKDLFERNNIRLYQEDNEIEPIQPYIRKLDLSHLLRSRFNGWFSVVLPNFNHEKYLPGRIESILEQDYKNFELIILDDASNDNSRQVIEKYSDPRITQFIISRDRQGSPFIQWIKGVLAAKYDHIWITESDDLAAPGFLSSMAAAIRNDPTAGVFYCDSVIINEEGQPGRKFSELKNDFFETNKWSSDYHQNGIDELNQFLKFACTINNASACVFRKDLLLAISGELTAWKYHGDWFSYIRSSFHAPVHYIAQPLNYVRTHSASLLARKDQLSSRLEHFWLLRLLVKNKKIHDREKLVRFFSEQYLGVSFRRDGLIQIVKTIALYCSRDFPLAWQVLGGIIRSRFTREKVKPVF